MRAGIDTYVLLTLNYFGVCLFWCLFVYLLSVGRCRAEINGTLNFFAYAKGRLPVEMYGGGVMISV